MKLLYCFYLIILISFMFLGCSSTVTRETTIQDTPEGGKEETILKIDDEVLTTLRTTWEKEYITAFGQAPVVEKYPEESRNKQLARKGAILDAERNMAEKISTIELTATTTMADFSTSDFVQSRIKTVLKDVEILIDRYDEKNKMYEVQIQMPKVQVIKIFEEYNNQ